MATPATTAVEDLLRLAWLADSAGRPRLRDALLTLAVAESGPEHAVLAERCRRLLVARQPSHWFATTATLSQALTHEKVAPAINRLRSMFPPVRVRHLLLKAEVERGPFLGRSGSFRRILTDLGLTPERPAGRPHPASVPFPAVETVTEPPDLEEPRELDPSLTPFYLAILFAMAVLVRQVIDQEKAGRDSARAA